MKNLNSLCHRSGTLLAMLLACAGISRAATDSIPLPTLPANTRLMIWGDSITEGNMYPTYVEEYLLVCAGRTDVKVFTSGHSGAGIGELVSRPIDLKAFNPTALMFQYGMNDTQYSPYTDQKGAAFSQTMQQGLSILASNGVTQRIVAGPGNVAPRYSTDPSVYQAQDYCLGQFSAIGRTNAVNSNSYFSDVYDRMQDSLAAADAVYGSTYGYDVHSGPNGAILFAYEDLKTLACDGNIGTINVDLNGTTTASAGHTVVSSAGGVVVLDSSKYPFCYNYDPSNTTGFESLDSMLPYVPFSQDLNRLVLTVTNLNASSANVTWGGQTKNFTSAQLAAGVNLAEQFSQTPFDATFAQIHAAIVSKQTFEDYEIKGTSNYFGNDSGGNVDTNMIAVQAQMDAAVKALFVPVRHTIVIVPTGTNGPAAPVITGTMMAYPSVGQQFSYQITTLNPATSFTATGLPAGLALNTSTGAITGTPTSTGVSVVNISATNAGGTSATKLTLTSRQPVPPQPYLNNPTTANAVVGVPFSYQITASNNPTNYFVTVQGSQGTEPPATSLPPGLTYDTNTGLISGTPTTAATYNNSVNLAAMNAGGVGAQLITLVIAASGSGGAPLAPTNLSATGGNGQITLAWTASTGATSYGVYRGTTPAGESSTAIATVTSPGYTDTTVTNGTAYYYHVAAINSAGTSGYSSEVSATPAAGGGAPTAPTGLSAVAGNMQVTLYWQPSTGATSYNLYRSTLTQEENSTPVATGITATTYQDKNLANGPTQYYKVAAVNAVGTSGYSNEASATPSASATNQSVISVQFNSSSIASSGLSAGVIPESIWNSDQTSSSYFTEETTGINNLKDSTGTVNTGLNEAKSDYGTYGPNAATTGFSNSGDDALFSHGVLANGGSEGFTLNLSGLNTGSTYDLILYTYSTQGTYAAAAVTATTTGAPTYYYTTAYSNQSSYIPATSTAAGVVPVANYVEWTGLTCSSGGLLSAALDAPGGMTVDGFQLVVHPGGNSTVPSTPTGFAAAPGSSVGQVTLSWSASKGAQSYLLQRGTSATGPYTPVTTVAAPAVSYADNSSSLVAGQNYYYEVAASNGNGTSPYSAYAVAQPEVPASYSGWTYTYFGSNPPASQAGPLADPANDGLSNLLKYALGLNPLLPATFQATLTHSGNAWQWTYQRPANRSDLSYAVQVSPDLSSNSWSSQGVTLVEIGTGDPETWQATYTPASGANCFFRLAVTTLSRPRTPAAGWRVTCGRSARFRGS